MKRIRCQVYGKVQNVYYRASAASIARELKLVGFARNNPDRSVTIEVQGEETHLDQFIDWCRKGPPEAVVENVVTTNLPLINEHGFESYN